MNVLDAHFHLWRLDAPGHDWPTATEAEIHRDFDLDDYRAATGKAGSTLTGAILVQAQPHEEETRRLLAIAARATIVKGVIGWADLAAPDAPARIAALARDPLLKGLRPMLQASLDTGWLLRPGIAPALGAMCDGGLRLDALVQPRHLPMLARLTRAWPDLPIVIDHAAKPVIGATPDDGWRDGIAALADLGLHCKLSGLRTGQTGGQGAEALQPFVDHLVARFGPRLMWGSDWPVIRMAGEDWGDWLSTARRLAPRADPERLFAGCAAQFYDIPEVKGRS